MKNTRRDFVKKATLGAAGLAIGGAGFSAGSYSRIVGSNSRINFAAVGTNGRGLANIQAVLACTGTAVTHICDVDSRALKKGIDQVKNLSNSGAAGIDDFRKLIENKDIDAVTIATPDHWHAPMAIMAAKAGKHVYLEKPSSHNPWENEILVEVYEKTGKVIQMGNQQRSAPTSIEAVERIRKGEIGKPYFGKAWYANTRGPIGIGKTVPVPGWLNWDLWQGPAPRTAYRDNIVHYNWHWFWRWGTGELLNNATHELDVCRWALGVDYPDKVSAFGGRMHHDGDDWEFYDTQVVNYQYGDDKLITWEGKSSNGLPDYNMSRGSLIQGTEGSFILHRNGFTLYDNNGEVVEEKKESGKSETTGIMGSGSLDVLHMYNFLEAIRNKGKLHSPVNDGAVSVNLCHLGNISQKVGRQLNINSSNGKILNDSEAMTLWKRDYEKGWEPAAI
ncbi:MAG: Gfo/Idh/MocA family oxidoreductase [Marinilabiliaceae bacterium]|jgi:predicted dehydrogenase|nr:Gfo/Idh/MocA family oxidoreductase [Marinilabiliaceae bacterium]